MQEDRYLPRILELDRPRGDGEIALSLGRWRVRITGLEDELAQVLALRWGAFVSRAQGADRAVLRAVRGTSDLWLPHWEWMERYRVEGTVENGQPVVRSYHFAMTQGEDAAWRLALADDPDEPMARVVENAVRTVVARLAVSDGGFAIHAAGALRRGRAYLLAGPSRSGKTTAIAVSRGLAEDLGDDLAVVLPDGSGWSAPALPFGSRDEAPPRPEGELFPVAGIYRLFQGEAPRVEELPRARAVASLVGCVASPWAVPDLADGILEGARRFVSTCRFAHLHFGMAPDFWPLLEAGPEP